MSDFETQFSSTLGRLDVIAKKIVQNQKDQQKMSQVLGTYLITITDAVENLNTIDDRLRQLISDSTDSIQDGLDELKDKEAYITVKNEEIQQLHKDKAALELEQLELTSAVFAKNAKNEDITQRFTNLEVEFQAKKAEDQAALTALSTDKQELDKQLEIALSSSQMEIDKKQNEIRALTTQIEANTAESNNEKQSLEEQLRLVQGRAETDSVQKQALIRALTTQMEENTAESNDAKRALEEQLRLVLQSAEMESTAKQTAIAELTRQIEENELSILAKNLDIEVLNDKINFVETENAEALRSKDAEIASTQARSLELQSMGAEELRTKMAECEVSITALNAEKTQLILEKEQLTADKVRLTELIRSATTTLEGIIVLLTTFEGASNAENDSSTAVSSQITQKLAEQTSKLREIVGQLNNSGGLISTDFTAPIIKTYSNPMPAADMSGPVNEPDEEQTAFIDEDIPQKEAPITQVASEAVVRPTLPGRQPVNLNQTKKTRKNANNIAIEEAGPPVTGTRNTPRVIAKTGVPVSRGGKTKKRRRRSSTKRRRRSTKRRNHKRKSTRKKRKGRKLSGGYTYSARTTI